MTKKIRPAFRQILLTFVLVAAGLSVSNPDFSLYQADTPGILQKPLPRLSSNITREEGPIAQLKAQLSSDDLADLNPFANLSSEVPLDSLLKRGVVSFERKALRSGAYRDEAGYDILHYEVGHPGGAKSQILAYVDRSMEGLSPSDSEPQVQKETLVLMVFQPTETGMELAVFRDGGLIETSPISLSEAESLLAQRLSNGIPFLSVAR